jgi:hypothetical protein
MLDFLRDLEAIDRDFAKLDRMFPVDKPGASVQLSESEIAALKADFPSFCLAVRIIDKAGNRIPFRLNHIQLIFEIQRTGRDIILKPRQIGFTTLELARDLWTFLSKPGARVVVVCQSVSDSGPAKLISVVLKVMIEGLRESGWPIEFETEAWNEWVLANGNSLRIAVAGASEASASKKGRAGTITRLHITETAFYEHARITLNALLECVPGPETGSEIVNESTANGSSGAFYDGCKAAQAKQSAYAFHFYPWFAHPEYSVPLLDEDDPEPQDADERRLAALGVTPEQLKWRRLKIEDKGRDLFNQEYPEDPDICFLTSGRTFFDQKATAAQLLLAQAPIETRERERIRIYKLPEQNARYVLAVDPSEGGGGDPSGGVMYNRETGEHVATIDGQYEPWALGESAAKLGYEYNTALIVVERNNHGHSVLQALEKINEDEPYPNVYRDADEKKGWKTDLVSRPKMLDELEECHRKGQWGSPDRSVLGQFKTFVVNSNGKPEAASGEHDDLVLAAAIGWAIVRRGRVVWVDPDELDVPDLSRWDEDDGRGFG